MSVNKDELLKDPKVAELLDNISDAIKVTQQEGNFIFTIESWGQLSPKAMIQEANKILSEKTEEFVKKIK